MSIRKTRYDKNKSNIRAKDAHRKPVLRSS